VLVAGDERDAGGDQPGEEEPVDDLLSRDT
jgi:hypothetical protein